ncbi:DUF1993 family protein [Lichenihabitans psoromatis]|uniref:DUF1993 family protein n=1 Tax=Lichenihabitans psoromatis TaxID=2528642 RepID=UPI001FE20674|nr:DUF1993 family protein [Lichenihabitans psoromatis]
MEVFMSLTELLVPTFKNMLRTLSGLLEKAEQQMPDRAEGLLAVRLTADMYPLSSQLRFAAYQAQEASFRLRGESIPSSLVDVATEGRHAGDVPGSLSQARARIGEALSFLDGLSGDALDAGAILPITLELPRGISFCQIASKRDPLSRPIPTPWEG